MIFTCLFTFVQAFKQANADPQPTPLIIPVSVSIDQFTKIGDTNCENGIECPNLNKNLNNYKPDDQNTYQCGKVCNTTTGSFEYKFKGEKFGIFGFRSTNYGSFKLTIDSTQYEIKTNQNTEENYVLLYLSNDLKYGEHSLKIQGIGNNFKLYKLVFWPSLKAKRLNITQFENTGSWDPESDQIGGVRMYNVRGGVDEKSIAQIQCSKIWIYGTKCSWHQTFNVQIGSFSAVVDEHVTEPAHPNRIDSALVYESPDLLYDNYEIVFTLPNLATLNYVYFLDEPQPTPSAVPISIPLSQFKKSGDAKCEGAKTCPEINDNINNYNPDDINTYQCGETCSATKGSLEYTFTGVKFGIFGFRSTNGGKFDLTVDSRVTEINTKSSINEDYVLLYISEDMSYRPHTVKIEGKGSTENKLYKFIFWPSLKAKRVNLTEFELTGNWRMETDTIGGVRIYNTEGGTKETATKEIRCTKMWIYGTRCDWHKKFEVQIGNEIKATINEYVDEPRRYDRIDSTLLFETPYMKSDSHNVVFSINEIATLNCIYYIDEPQPTPSVVPISIPFSQFKKSGDAKCEETKTCPEINDDISNYNPDDINTYQCGETCSATTGSLEYTFTGVKFGIFGFRSTNGGKFDLTVDSRTTEINTQSTTNEDYVLLYISEDMSYRPHTVKIEGKGSTENKLYKFIFWPSLKAKRVNLTEFALTGNWRMETDTIGGVRIYNTEGGTKETATKEIRCTKMWIYGTKCDWHKRFEVQIGNEIKATINEYVDEPRRYDRIDSTLLFETPNMRSGNHNVVFTINEIATLNCIYYVDEPQPIPTPSAIPISISMSQFTGNGHSTTYNTVNKCQTDDLELSSVTSCGAKAISFIGTFSYTFLGSKFALIGFKSSHYGKFEVEVDSKVTEVNTNQDYDEDYTVVHVSDDLPYGNHTVNIKGKREQFALHKLVFWPTLTAKRINLTEFKLEGKWQTETDEIGGIRAYTEKGGVNEIATKDFRCSKIWIYGSRCSWHDEVTFTIGNISGSFNESIQTAREDYVMLYESVSFEELEYTLKFTILTTATLNCIYYEGTQVYPVPTPAVIPVSISLGQFSNDAHSTVYSPVENCPTDDLSSPSSYQCGTKVVSSIGSFNYKFRGVKFAIIGFKSPHLGKFEIDIDSKVVEIDSYNHVHEDYVTLYVSDDLDNVEHTLSIKGKRNEYHLHKIVYWPSLTAFRVNITDFNLKGNWISESDLIGGIRSYTVEGGVDETASKDMRCSKIWVFGSTCSWHGEVTYTIGEISGKFTEYSSEPRKDFVLLYESENFKYQVNTLTFVINSTATLNYIYYLDEPPDRTPLPTPEPTPKSEELTDCGTDYKRCIFAKEEGQEFSPTTIHIKASHFKSYNDSDTKDGGGAIRIKNAGIEIDKIEFEECKSAAGGGAIFIENKIDYELPVVLDNIAFTKCEATYGGGMYVHSKSWKSIVLISNCEFIDNKATGNKNDNPFGGSALFIMAVNCNIKNNLFKSNKGIGGSVKIIGVSAGNSRILSFNKWKIYNSNTISNSVFEIDKEADCSLFFESGNSKFKLVHSIFKGVLAPNAHHIDGIGNKNYESKLIIEKCQFDSNAKRAINLNKKNIQFASFESNNKVFNDDKLMNSWGSYLAIIVSLVGLLVLLSVILVFKYKNDNNSNEVELNEIQNPLSSTEINE